MLDKEEFKAIYMQYQELVMKVAFDHLRDYYAAQDICQETFLRLSRYLDSMPKERIKPWLIVVAANLSKDVLKKGGKYLEIAGLPDDRELEGHAELQYEVDARLEKVCAGELCKTALAKLREKNQTWYEILILVEYMEIPRKKVAEVRGVSLSAVDGYLKRAKTWLRDNYVEEYENL